MSVLRRADFRRPPSLIDCDYSAQLLTALPLGSLSKDCLCTEGMLASDSATSLGVETPTLKLVALCMPADGMPADFLVLLAVECRPLVAADYFAASRFSS